MDFKVILTDQAIDDLRSIAGFIAKDDPDGAVAFGNQLIEKALTLNKFPEQGRVVPEVGDPVFREISLRPYRIIYEVDKIHQEV
jgi:toxin ParE1/3/4